MFERHSNLWMAPVWQVSIPWWFTLIQQRHCNFKLCADAAHSMRLSGVRSRVTYLWRPDAVDDDRMRWARMSSTMRKLSGKRNYSHTASAMISAWKQWRWCSEAQLRASIFIVDEACAKVKVTVLSIFNADWHLYVECKIVVSFALSLGLHTIQTDNHTALEEPAPLPIR